MIGKHTKGGLTAAFYHRESDYLTIERIECDGKACAAIRGTEKVIIDAQSALELLLNANAITETKRLVVPKELIVEEFFILSSGLAGEVLQKLINYGGRIAIYGDFTRYTSKPLRDFMYESNKGRDVYFAATEDEAVAAMTR